MLGRLARGPFTPSSRRGVTTIESLSAASSAAICDPTLMIGTGERLRSDRGARRAVARARCPAEKRNREAWLVRDDALLRFLCAAVNCALVYTMWTRQGTRGGLVSVSINCRV
jgi:hypothetical protein